jgi:hypothetical protein
MPAPFSKVMVGNINFITLSIGVLQPTYEMYFVLGLRYNWHTVLPGTFPMPNMPSMFVLLHVYYYHTKGIQQL